MIRVAVVLPCYNEELTVAQTVRDFRAHFPDARVIVFDNNSVDRSAELARAAGAEVIPSRRQGKGNVVRHIFAEVDADYYVMSDADCTYPAASGPALLRAAIDEGLDMVVGTRLKRHGDGSFRRFHVFGNLLISGLLSRLFGRRIEDALSGFRVFSRAFAEEAPLMSEAFEIETELTVQALDKGFRFKEMPIEYGERPPGSHSKLNTFRDGWRIIRLILKIFKDYRPFHFFSLVAAALTTASLAAGFLPIQDYVRTSYVSHVPLAVLAAALMSIAVLSFYVGLLLDSIQRYDREHYAMFKRLLRTREHRARERTAAPSDDHRDGANGRRFSEPQTTVERL